MDFDLSEEHKMLKEAVRDFAEKEIAPLVEEAEAREEFPVKLIPRMGELGYLCTNYPPVYGGGGMGLLGPCIVIEELARVCLGIASGINGQSGSGTVILAHGTEEQKQKYIPPVCRGERYATWAVNEPSSGSDIAAMQGTARLDGNEWVINARKTFLGNAPWTDYTAVVVKTGESFSVFLVEPVVNELPQAQITWASGKYLG